MKSKNESKCRQTLDVFSWHEKENGFFRERKRALKKEKDGEREMNQANTK